MARITKAELVQTADRLTRQTAVQSLALRYLATGAEPDWTETVRWTEQGRTVEVSLRAYGLARADGGVVVALWDFPGEASWVEVCYMLDATGAERRKHIMAMARFALSDAMSRLYGAHVAAVQASA